MLNLNFGSGTSRKQGFISVDLYIPEADIALDLTEPLPWKDCEVDNIHASHVVEHFSRKEWELVSKEWSRVLKPGGTIEIFCPDIIGVCRNLLKNPDDEYVMMQLYGLQANDGEYHKNGFTERSLASSFPDMQAKHIPDSDETQLHMIFIKGESNADNSTSK